jgi:hypothetical protein
MTHVSALDIGPGPKSVLRYLPIDLKRRIIKYSAFEPNGLFVLYLESWLRFNCETEVPLPGLKCSPDTRRLAFTLDINVSNAGSDGENGRKNRPDFC